MFAQRTLSNDFFVNLLRASFTMRWRALDDGSFVATDRASGEEKWRGSRVDLIFGSNAQLRALAEVYAAADGERAFIDAFTVAWVKVMNADRFELAGASTSREEGFA